MLDSKRAALVLWSCLIGTNWTFPVLPQQTPAEDASRIQSEQELQGPNATYRRRIVREGIAVELAIDHIDPGTTQPGVFTEGDDVRIRFQMYDTASGTPLRGTYPGAWMDLLADGESQANEAQCAGKVRNFVGGTLFGRAELDLTVYYVLALNEDATITVVDPRFSYGDTRLLSMPVLESPGADWISPDDQKDVFVSMPDSNKVAVIETFSWTVKTNLEVGGQPGRVRVQPDQAYLWVAYQNGERGSSGVVAFRLTDLQAVARIETGAGDHQMAFTPDNRYLFVTDPDADQVSVIDIRKLEKVKAIRTGSRPTSIAFSRLAQAAYIVNQEGGTVSVVDGARLETVATIEAQPGLGQISLTPDQRFGFVLDPGRDLVHIIDTASNRIVQTASVEDHPHQIAFTDELAYVSHRGHEDVLMIPLIEIGKEGAPVPVVDFPGGQHPVGESNRHIPAAAVVQASGEFGVLVANPKDQAIYFYREGMAAPMGNFSNYGKNPLAAMVVERNLQEKRPGTYETSVRLRSPGAYDIAFLLDSPRIVECFGFFVQKDPELEEARTYRPAVIEPLIEETRVQTGVELALRFRITDSDGQEFKPPLEDVTVLLFGSAWQRRVIARHVGGTTYQADIAIPRPGYYPIYVRISSAGLAFTPSGWVQAEDEDPGQE